MGAAQLGMLTGSFIMSLLFAVVWLLICKAIPAMRRNIRGSYGVAMLLAALPAVVSAGGITVYGIVGAAVCIALLFWQMRRAQAKQLVAASPANHT